MTRRLLALLALSAAVVVSGCGSQDPGNAVVEADTEGVWVDAGTLDYHIQGSRQLNPAQVPDDRYLAGLPSGFAQPKPNEIWFAVFLRIENKTDKAAPSAEEFEITDTEGKSFRPVQLDAKANPFAYTPQQLGADEVIPHPDSTQDFDSTSGSMLLFKLPLTTIADRPLEFRIKAPPGQPAPKSSEINLDV